jgi:hypothetical protein
MRRAALAVIVIALATDSADACHHYRVWLYPQPQSCRMTALAPRSAIRLPRARIDVSLKAAPPARPVSPPAISIPSLTDIDWGRAPDDELRGRLLLRVILQGKEDR